MEIDMLKTKIHLFLSLIERNSNVVLISILTNCYHLLKVNVKINIQWPFPLDI